MMRREVTTWFLEMRSPSALRAAACPNPAAVFVRAEIPSPELSRFLYTAVGGPWFWLGRLDWDFRQWMAYLDRPALETWLLSVRGTPAGYVELEAQADDAIEIVLFGLLPSFVGQGLGRYFLSAAVARAWARGAQRVWLHTCSLDGPHALANYQARGFVVYDQRTQVMELPDISPGPWPGAGV
jgi:GNAT superfamily N-acetyltransferase